MSIHSICQKHYAKILKLNSTLKFYINYLYKPVHIIIYIYLMRRIEAIKEEPVSHSSSFLVSNDVNNDSNIFFLIIDVYCACILFLETQFVNCMKNE